MFSELGRWLGISGYTCMSTWIQILGFQSWARPSPPARWEAERAHRPTSLACSVVNSIKPCLTASEDQHAWLPPDPVPVLRHLNTHIHSNMHVHTYMYTQGLKWLYRPNESPAKFQLLFCCFQSQGSLKKTQGLEKYSVVRSSCCSCRGPRFCLQHPHSRQQSFVTPVPRESSFFFWPCWVPGMYMVHRHACSQSICEKLNRKYKNSTVNVHIWQ